MNRFKMTVLSAAAAGVAAIVAPACAQDARTPETIIAEFDAVKAPRFTGKRGADDYQEKLQEYYAARAVMAETQAALILELYETSPDHERISKLMPQRWSLIGRAPGGSETVLEETSKIMKSGKGELAVTACFTYASTIGSTTNYSQEEFEPALAAFIKMAPDDDRPAQLLMSAARGMKDADQQLATYKRVLKDYPDSKYTKYTGGKIKQVDQLGKPFKLEFSEATSGETISIKELRGKVVVIDFWATWCGPCIAEMPHMKKLYAAYKEKGVEFIGVSLDQPEDKGGLDKLRKYCVDNDIDWPQYYQGNYWSSEYSVSWGINSIPAMFVIDQKGNLKSVNARGKLVEMLPEMLGIDALVQKEEKGG